MPSISLVLLSLLGTAVASPILQNSSYVFSNTSGTDQLASDGMKKLEAYAASNDSATDSNCTLYNAAKRKEWSDLTSTERKSYISAVLCLQSLPTKSNLTVIPGARSRYDDFVSAHIIGTNVLHTIHEVGQFLSWHRYFVWNYEKALRNECGYEGYQPYWNWGKYAHDPINSPVFDGSDESMSGNGEFRAHPDNRIPAANITPNVILPAGQGGGCVTSGPFKNFTVNLGGQTPLYDYVTLNPQTDGLGYNPRCMRRDISQYVSSTATSDQNTTDLIKNSDDIGSFQNTMQAIFPELDAMGVHAGGHFTIAGDPGGDLHDSAGDPAFWLHHGQIDRVWWIWQNQDPSSRHNVIAGTLTFANDPPSRNTTLDDVVDLSDGGAGGFSESKTIGELVDTLAGPFCYVYV